MKEIIHFAVTQSSLGMVLAARSYVGLCALALGDDIFSLRTALHLMFDPRVSIRALPDVERDDFIAMIDRVVEGKANPQDVHLALDMRGTDFDILVWNRLRLTDPGKTMTYGEIATAINMPHAARAVAQACSRNRIAIFIPCHRAIPVGNRGVGGYRWGVERKEALLRREQQLLGLKR